MAQMVLPGALPAVPAAGKPSRKLGPDGLPLKRAKPAAVKPIGEEAITSRELTLNGAHGRIEFVRNGDALNVTAMTIDGSQISRPDDSCRLDVVSGTPLTTRPLGRPMGTLRYQIDLASCPFSFDILEGAILVEASPKICEFKAADCKVDPAGLWGPRGTSFSPEKIKEIERARNHAEATMRENFRELLARLHARPAIKAAASEQAGFSSVRADICRDYAREDVHGFCALRLTEARAQALKASIGNAGPDLADKIPDQKRRRSRSAVPM